jgi:hypothetical protein
MDPARLILCALLILAPPLAYTAGIIIYSRRRRARCLSDRPTVAEINARVEAEQAGRRDHAEDVDQDEETEPPTLPPGWHWPDGERE